MKRILLASLAAVAFTACTSGPTYTNQPPEYRNPAGLGDSVQASSNVASDVSGTVVHAAIDISQGSWNGSKAISAGLSDALKGSVNGAKDLAIIGWGASKESSAVVVAAVSEVPRLLGGSARFVVTTSGQVFEASVNASKTAIGVSVDLAQGSSDAVVRFGTFVIGSVRVSAEASKDVALWGSEKSADAVRWTLNASGELATASGNVIGYVVDTSGRVIHFALDKSGKLLTISGEASVAVIHGSSDAVSSLAQNVKEGLKGSSNFISTSVTASAQGTLLVLRWSANGVSHSSKVVTNSIRHILYSAPETRTY